MSILPLKRQNEVTYLVLLCKSLGVSHMLHITFYKDYLLISRICIAYVATSGIC